MSNPWDFTTPIWYEWPSDYPLFDPPPAPKEKELTETLATSEDFATNLNGDRYTKLNTFRIEDTVETSRGYVYLGQYLWNSAMYPKISELIDMVRPINTVPHIRAVLTAKTAEDGKIQTISTTRVSTVVSDQWQYTRHYFDDAWDLDSGVFWDQSFSGFIGSIVKFKVGTGHKGQEPTHTGFALEYPVYEGYDIDTTIEADKITFECFILTAPAYSKLSELVLTLGDDTVVLACTFPDTDKTAGMELCFRIEVTP